MRYLCFVLKAIAFLSCYVETEAEDRSEDGIDFLGRLFPHCSLISADWRQYAALKRVQRRIKHLFEVTHRSDGIQRGDSVVETPIAAFRVKVP
jgi:(p)ppGpp synthase/HD superfamily hydrolase